MATLSTKTIVKSVEQCAITVPNDIGAPCVPGIRLKLKWTQRSEFSTRFS